MSGLSEALTEYVSLRRSMGFVLKEACLLVGFVGYLEQRGAEHVTTELALSWATSTPGVLAVTRSQRLGAVRAFCVYLHAFDPDHEVPPVGLLPGPYTRIRPYIYSKADVTALMTAANALAPPWRARTYQTLIGLLASTGIRLGEALGLDDTDVDHPGSTMTVRHSKREVARQVPLHTTVLAALADYAAERDRRFGERSSRSLLASTLGIRPGPCTVEHTFARLVVAAGLVAPDGRRAPRLHDLRHTFAVDTLTEWHRHGLNIDAAMPLLSKVLGHVNPASTYWYLQAAPELFEVVAARVSPAFEALR